MQTSAKIVALISLLVRVVSTHIAHHSQLFQFLDGIPSLQTLAVKLSQGGVSPASPLLQVFFVQSREKSDSIWILTSLQ